VIDHLVYATPTLDETVAKLQTDLGIELVPGGAHVGRGTRNYLAGLGGDRYLEVIGPDLEQPAPASPRPFGVDDLTEARLVTWCCRPHSPLNNVHLRVSLENYDLGQVISMSRRRPDGVLLEWELTARVGDPGDACIPFVIDWKDCPHPSASLRHTTFLDTLTLQHPDRDQLGRVLAALESTRDVSVSDDGRTMFGPDIVLVDGASRLVASLQTPSGRLKLA
jgi:Glyoxalase-like domain